MTKVYTSKNWLYKKYIVERLSQEEIAVLANTTQVTILRWLKKHGIDKRK